MKFVVHAKNKGQWHQIETITEKEAGGKVAGYKAAKGLAKACEQFPGTTETKIDKLK